MKRISLNWVWQVSKAFFHLLEVLSHAHAPVMAATDTATFAFMVGFPVRWSACNVIEELIRIRFGTCLLTPPFLTLSQQA